jgi:2-amino-4-hydroxy-6-hydroxymethyldihydropteridine diphosphokinase
MIYIGLGANLPSEAGAPLATLAAALDELQARNIVIVARSRWYRTTPVPPSDQPWFVNGVVGARSSLSPLDLLHVLQAIEMRFGRQRGIRNAARTLDLDLLDYDGRVEEAESLVLPHPRMHERAFVLLPLREIAPTWRHPRLGQTVSALIAALAPDQIAIPVAAQP